jgi:hypothetical protein
MKSQAPKLDVTPMLARQVIELYADELADVRFPDLDLAALRAAQDALHAAQLEVERIEDKLASARAELEHATEHLNAKAERALAYARIFALGDAALAPKVAEIGRKRPAADGGGDGAAPAKRRGRRSKAEAPSQLFAGEEVSAEQLS